MYTYLNIFYVLEYLYKMILLRRFIKLYKHVFRKKTIFQSIYCEKYKLMKEFFNMQKIIIIILTGYII